jgi:spore photoproduct lyase
VIDTIYVEEDLQGHPRAREICARFPNAVRVPIERYGEVFNKNQQNFRLQKKKPSLVLARKHGRTLLPAPYGIGGRHNYYFSHILNCLYDCRYCFLQGMYRSAHYVVFVNFEDFKDQMVETLALCPEEDVYFFSGYDGDSLALDSVTSFVHEFLPFFGSHRRAILELRTKSVAIRPLLARDPIPNCIVAFSFTPESASALLEHGVPGNASRIEAASHLAERGWKVGLRFDPLLYTPTCREHYRRLFADVFASLPVGAIHSVSLGPFRLPRDYFQRMVKLYPEERLFAGPLDERNGMVSYRRELEKDMETFCLEALHDHVAKERVFTHAIEMAP